MVYTCRESLPKVFEDKTQFKVSYSIQENSLFEVFDNSSRLNKAESLTLWKQAPQLIRRAKPGDADLLSQIQKTNPEAMNAAHRTTLSPLAFEVVRWLRVSNFHVNNNLLKLITTM